MLEYGFTACRGCPKPGLDLAEVRRDHPEWILHDEAGAEVHPADHPDWVLFDYGNVKFQQAWAERVTDQLSAGGWTGIELLDAGNTQRWSGQPIDPVTGEPMTEADRGALPRPGHRGGAGMAEDQRLLAGGRQRHSVGGRPGPDREHRAVTLGAGFASRTGVSWQTLFTYFQAAVTAHVGAWIEDDGELDTNRRVYGLASYLLVSGPQSSYGIDQDVAADPLYRVDPGEPLDPATQNGGVWTREFSAGSVAVNPGADAEQVTLKFGGTVTVPASGAVIAVDDHTYTSAGNQGGGARNRFCQPHGRANFRPVYCAPALGCPGGRAMRSKT